MHVCVLLHILVLLHLWNQPLEALLLNHSVRSLHVLTMASELVSTAFESTCAPTSRMAERPLPQSVTGFG